MANPDTGIDEARAMRIYVASSWRNQYQPAVVSALRHEGFDVYDFRNPAPGNGGFSWRLVDTEWEKADPVRYLQMLVHPVAEEGFKLDMDALSTADLCVMIMPCGMSASLETGYAIGAGKPTAVFVPGLREPDLMVKMADLVTDDIDALLAWTRCQRKAAVRSEARAQVSEELPDWMPNGAELANHVNLYRALKDAVAALDPAAGDDRLQSEWTSAKWAVFNAAVRLVKETEDGNAIRKHKVEAT